MLAGRAALVTGGGSGIGLGCARALVHDGCHVVVMGRSEERLVEAVKALRSEAPHGTQGAHIAGDVTSEHPVVADDPRARVPNGTLHVRVANAGLGDCGALLRPRAR